MDSLKIIVLSVIWVIGAILAYRYPRQGLWALLIYLPFEGTFSPTMLSGYPGPIFLLTKDLLCIPAVIAILQTYWRERQPIPVPRFLLLMLAALLVSALLTLLFVNGRQQLFANGDEHPMLMGIWGLKILIGYVPLILCGHYLIRNRQDLDFLMRLTLGLILVVCSLALIQYLLLRTGYCSVFEGKGAQLFRASLNARCFVGGSLLYSPSQGQIRLPGTFSSPWQWSWFLISSGFLACSAAFNDSLLRWRVLGFIALIFAVATSLLTGQTLAAGGILVTFLLLTRLTRQRIGLSGVMLIGLGVVGLLGSVSVSNSRFLQHPLLFLRFKAEFLAHQVAWAIRSMDSWLGAGLGRGTNSARLWGEIRLIETYYVKLLYEMGPLGLLAFLALVTGLIYVTFKAWRGVRDRTLRNYGQTLWLFVLLVSCNPYYYPLDTNPVAIYYWFFAGVILALPALEQPAISALDQPE